LLISLSLSLSAPPKGLDEEDLAYYDSLQELRGKELLQRQKRVDHELELFKQAQQQEHTAPPAVSLFQPRHAQEKKPTKIGEGPDPPFQSLFLRSQVSLEIVKHKRKKESAVGQTGGKKKKNERSVSVSVSLSVSLLTSLSLSLSLLITA
jgi:hypothetical protein